MDRAETYELSGELKKNFESAIEIMYNSKYIKVGGCEIPQDEVRNRLENISYEHIVYVCNNMPREVTPNGNCAKSLQNKVPYIVTALYNSLRYTAEEIKEIEYGDFYNST